MNFSPLFKRIFALLACVGLVSFGALRLAAADHAEPAAAAAHAAAPAHEAAHADHGDAGHDAHAAGGHAHKPAIEVTFVSQFLYSYLTAYMFCLSIVVGAMFLVILHHLFDASWSVPIRRVNEQIACLMPVMGLLCLPIIILAPQIYPWMNIDPATDHALDVKKVLFNRTSFTVLLVVIFGLWSFMALNFRRWSVAQDKDGAAKWTSKARFQAAWGIFAFAITLTLVVFLLMKSLMHQFFSTMYGVYYFAGSVWTTLATVYGIVFWLKSRELKGVIYTHTMHFIGTLFFAFTVFYAYIHFSQYFLIWNAAIPEETFWYVKREVGSWWQVGLLILFGHFFVPFLILLRIDTKLNPLVMGPMILWAWLMHYTDMTFNVMPVLYPEGLHVTLLDPICWVALSAVLALAFWKNFKSAAPFPLKDPRLKEALTHHEVPVPGAAAAHH
jgi:hypothetical protein